MSPKYPRSIVAALVAPAALVALASLASCGGTRSASRSEPHDADHVTTTTAAEIVLAPKTPSPPKTASTTACSEGMLLIEGEACPDVEQHCLEWMEPPGDRYHLYRCARYAKPAVCKSKQRVHKRFCIDATERREAESDLPRNNMSWTTSKELCESEGARLCMASEWTFACEGEEMRPYAYGWERDAKACNVDVMTGLGNVGRLVDHRAKVGSLASCVSPFGVHDMAGNVDEWTTLDGAPQATRAVMKGSWWLPGRHACRNHQAGHDAYYHGTETGTRCCQDAPSTDRVSSR